MRPREEGDMLGRVPPYARERRVFKGSGGVQMALLGFPEHLLCWAQTWANAQSSLKAQMEPFPSEAFVLGVGGSWLTSLHRCMVGEEAPVGHLWQM